MKWLILSNNKKEIETLEKTIRLRDSNCLIDSFSLSKQDTSNWITGLYDYTDIIALAAKADLEKPETQGLLFSLSGYCTRGSMPLYTNLTDLEKYSVGNPDSIKVFKSVKALNDEISQNYTFILNLAKKQEASKFLLNRGIPFTVDCFADYITKGKFEICRQFLTAGMDINSRDEKGTPMLNIAVRTDKEEIVSWMIDNGADLNVVSEDRGYSPLMDAVWRGNEEITQFLIEHNADVNTICKEGQSNLVIAVGAGKTKIVEMLAHAGADPDIKDSMGMSAYEYAVLFKKEEISKILFPFHKLP
ncbi:MAG: ankyrin repeat domain-containing protein [Treponema sp.]|nr:ankyrin repeat domain-containing protein [Treponema sp.]